MTLKEFLKKHDLEIDVLELYDTSGKELDSEDPRWENCRVIAYSKEAGFFDVEIDPVIRAKI